MTKDSGVGVGKRLADARHLKGWTQARLSSEAKVSTSLVSQVEQERVPASPAFLAAVSRALGIGIVDLTEQPYARNTAAEQRVHEGIAGIRRELAAYRTPPDGTAEARPLVELSAEVHRASKLRHSVNLTQLGAMMPGLLSELRTAWNTFTGPELEQVYGLAAEAYAACSQVAYKLGYIDLSSLCVERYEWAAAKSGDPLAVLAGDYQRAGELICAADWSGALRYLEQSLRMIEPDIGFDDPATLSMWGSLHLKGGLAAARAGNKALADDHLAEAQETADRIGVDRDDYRLCFGPTNVAIWSVGLAVEMMDGTTAVARSQDVHLPSDTKRERAAHYWIDLGRGYLLHGDRDRSFGALRKAKELAPTMARYHPMVHETLRVLARDDARSTETLRGFAAWCGINR